MKPVNPNKGESIQFHADLQVERRCVSKDMPSKKWETQKLRNSVKLDTVFRVLLCLA